jgi:hypothetical protein
MPMSIGSSQPPLDLTIATSTGINVLGDPVAKRISLNYGLRDRRSER